MDYIIKFFEFFELFSCLSNVECFIVEVVCIEESEIELLLLCKDFVCSFEYSLFEFVEIVGIECVIGYVSFENYFL